MDNEVHTIVQRFRATPFLAGVVSLLERGHLPEQISASARNVT